MKVLGETGTNTIVEAIKKFRISTTYPTHDDELEEYKLYTIPLTKKSNKFVISESYTVTPDATITVMGWKEGMSNYIIVLGVVNCIVKFKTLLYFNHLSDIIEAISPLPESVEEISSVNL